MALKLTDGKYVRLDLDKCYIDRNGIHVAYFQYADDKTRLKEETNNKKLSELLCNISKYVDENICKIQEHIENYSEIKSQQELLDSMSVEDKELYDTIHSLEEDSYTILSASQVGDLSAEKQLHNLKLLKQLGYTADVLEKVQLGNSCIGISGVFTNQKFTYEDMYKELKKIFKKEGYMDC